jgi:hypothetical protein
MTRALTPVLAALTLAVAIVAVLALAPEVALRLLRVPVL